MHTTDSTPFAARLDDRGAPVEVTAGDPACWSVPGHDRASCTRAAPGGYCTPRRCGCAGCPWHVAIDVLPTNTPDAFTAFDRGAVARGQRVSGPRRRAARGTPDPNV